MDTPYINWAGKKFETVEIRREIRDSGIVWRMELEKITSASGKTVHYHIHHYGGQSYPVGDFRSLKAAMRCLDSMSSYRATS